MTPAELELRGQLLYGRQWQGDLARNIGVSTMSVTRWKTGRTKIKPEIESKIADLLAKRALLIRSLIADDGHKNPRNLEKCRQCAS